MRSSRRVLFGLVAFLAVYSLIALPNREHERYPFFAWNLFSEVPEPVARDYGVRIVRVDDNRSLRPFYFEDGGFLIPLAHDVRAQQLQQRIGSAAEGRRGGLEQLRHQFEVTYLHTLGEVEYEVVRRTFDVRQRYRCGCFRREVVVDTFVKPA